MAPDFITTLYQNNIDHILDRIFLTLPKNDILVCQSVSLSWCQIVQHYQKSKNFRIQRILDFKIEEEWRKGNPAWRAGALPLDKEAFIVKSFIADKDYIAIAAHNYHTNNGLGFLREIPYCIKIIILDSKTLQVCKILQVKEETGAYATSKAHVEIKLALNDNHLAAYCRKNNCSDSIYYIWNRDGNFSQDPLQIKTNCPHSVEADCHPIEMPCLKNGKLTSVSEVQTLNRSKTFVFYEWDILEKSKRQLGQFHQRSEAGKNFFRCQFHQCFLRAFFV